MKYVFLFLFSFAFFAHSVTEKELLECFPEEYTAQAQQRLVQFYPKIFTAKEGDEAEQSNAPCLAKTLYEMLQKCQENRESETPVRVIEFGSVSIDSALLFMMAGADSVVLDSLNKRVFGNGLSVMLKFPEFYKKIDVKFSHFSEIFEQYKDQPFNILLANNLPVSSDTEEQEFLEGGNQITAKNALKNFTFQMVKPEGVAMTLKEFDAFLTAHNEEDE